MADQSISKVRRKLLGGALAVTGSGLMPGASLLSHAAFAAEQPIKIGHQCDLTGALASTGYWRKKATDACAQWINQNGGIAGRQIQVVTIDTESKVDVGVSRLRQLIQEQNVDFVIGSQHGGVSVASNAVVRELNAICLSMSRTDSVTGEAATPNVFRLMVDNSLTAKAAGKWAVENTGKRWAVIYADYIWGQSHRDAWSKQVEVSGGKVVQAIPMPVNTPDPLPYVGKLDRSVDAIFVALLGPDVPRTLPALRQVGLGSKPIVTADALFGVFDILGMGSAANGLWGMDSAPWELADKDTPHVRNMRKIIGVDEMGRELGTKRACMVGDVWPAWENLGFIKQNVEGSRWKSRSDNGAFIKHAEANPKYAESAFFPQGELFVRPEDHQAFCDYYILRVEDRRLRTKKRIAKEDGIYPPTVKLNAV